MGIVLRPRRGSTPISAEDLAACLRENGFDVQVDVAEGKRAIVEQILFRYQRVLDTEQFDPTAFDEIIAEYPRAAVFTIDRGDLDDSIEFMFTTGEYMGFGECFPTNADSKSVAVMSIASLIGYVAEGE